MTHSNRPRSTFNRTCCRQREAELDEQCSLYQRHKQSTRKQTSKSRDVSVSPNVYQRGFDEIDQNGDGVIDREEWSQYTANHASVRSTCAPVPPCCL